MASAFSPVGAPDGRRDPVRLTRPHHDGTGSVAEDESGVAVGGLHDDRHRLDADNQHVLGRTCAHGVGGNAERVAEAAAAGSDVVGRNAVEADVVGDDGAAVRDLRLPAVGGQDQRADLLLGDARVLDGALGRSCGHRPRRLVAADPASIADTAALEDPLIGAVEDLAYLVIADQTLWSVCADAQHRDVLMARVGGDDAHKKLPFDKYVVAARRRPSAESVGAPTTRPEGHLESPRRAAGSAARPVSRRSARTPGPASPRRSASRPSARSRAASNHRTDNHPDSSRSCSPG